MVRETGCAVMVVFPYYRLPGFFDQITLQCFSLRPLCVLCGELLFLVLVGGGTKKSGVSLGETPQ